MSLNILKQSPLQRKVMGKTFIAVRYFDVLVLYSSLRSLMNWFPICDRNEVIMSKAFRFSFTSLFTNSKYFRNYSTARVFV